MESWRECINCHNELTPVNGVLICRHCNSPETEQLQEILEPGNCEDYIFIECPGATLYDPATDGVIRGVKFFDDNDPFKGYKIIDGPVYAPAHTKRRRIKREALGHIRRCQACQDYTIRMRRKEGTDFCIPSHRFPNRTKLMSVTARSVE